MDQNRILRYRHAMKHLTTKPWLAGLIQAVAVSFIACFAISLSFGVLSSFAPDPFAALLSFCTFAMLDLLIVLAYPLGLIVDGKGKEAFAVLRWTFLWLIFMTVLWIVCISPYMVNNFGLID